MKREIKYTAFETHCLARACEYNNNVRKEWEDSCLSLRRLIDQQIEIEKTKKLPISLFIRNLKKQLED